MNISHINYNFYNIKRPINFCAKRENERPKTKSAHEKTTQKGFAPSAEYYAAINNIKDRRLLVIMPGKNGANAQCYKIPSSITDAYLLNENDKTDQSLLEKFIYEFTKNAEKMNKISSKKISVLKENVELIPSNIIELQTPKDLQARILQEELDKNGSLDEAIYGYLSRISGDFKRYLSEKMLEAEKESASEIKNRALKQTVRFFELSKTGDQSKKGVWAYDFSNRKMKYEFLEMIAMMEECGNKDIFDEILAQSKKEDGSVDFELAFQIGQILQDAFASPEFIKNTLEHFYSKDPESKDEIFKMIMALGLTDYKLDEQDPTASNLIEHCFDESGKFSTRKADEILSFIKTTDSWICEKDTEEDLSLDETLAYIAVAGDIIMNYLDQSNSNEQAGTHSFKKYFQTAMKNIRAI